VIWHGYLLGATGSNIYTHHLVDSWVRAGHDVVLACQEPDPTKHPRIHEVLRLAHDTAAGTVAVAAREHVRDPEPGHGRCTMVVPDVHGLLPVYVLDRYEGYEVVRVPGLEPVRLAAYAEDHAAAMRWVIGEFGPDGVLINHATPLPPAVAPVLVEAGVPFAVKVHGSELEYALAEDATLVEPAREALEQAASILVGSDHIAMRTIQLLGESSIAGRTHVVPPGVDLEHFRPIGRDDESRAHAHARLLDELRRRIAADAGGRPPSADAAVRELVQQVDHDPDRAAQLVGQLDSLHADYEERHVETLAADGVHRLELEHRALLVFVGKLIPQKGVHLLLAALPDVLERHPEAHLVVAGFGPLRDGLEAMLVAMARRDAAALDALADGMGALSGEGGELLPHLRGWLDLLRERGELDAWLDRAAAARVDERVTWLGLVDHAVLAQLWPLGELSIVPSVLAEAFGMVAAEAAACGCVPVVADHSGLADAASVIELDGVEPVRFAIEEPLGTAIGTLAAALIARLDLDAEERARQSAQARANVAAAWGWDELAAQVAGLMCAAPVR
jgi:glycosyltransferase involved in cell wall biosynthesis